MDWIPLIESHRLPALCGLYLIRHRESGREYVGKSVNVRQRAAHHRRANSGVTYLYKAIRKHGVNAFEVCLYATGTEAEMTALEIEVITARGTFNPDGYNQTRGGDGISGYRATAEHRAAIVARQTGRPILPETKEKMREARLAHNQFKGRKHTPETLAKMSAALRGRTVTRSPEGQAAINTATARRKGTKWKVGHSEETKRHLSEVKKGVPKPAGFAERLRGDGNPMYGKRGKDCHKARQVLVWLPDSLTPATFDTVEEAATWMGCSAGSISDWCRERYRPKNGFAWAYP